MTAIISGVVVISTGIGTIVSILVTSRAKRLETQQLAEIKRQERLEDFARQDEVALRLHQTTVEAQQEAHKAVLVAEDTADAAQATARSMNDKLDVIHILVNSDMTTAIQNELTASLLLLEVLKRVHGDGPMTEDTVKLVQDTEEKIANLRMVLADRERQTMQADKERSGQ